MQPGQITTRPIAIQSPGHGCMNGLTTERYIWFIYLTCYPWRFVQPGTCRHPVGAGIKCLYCIHITYTTITIFAHPFSSLCIIILILIIIIMIIIIVIIIIIMIIIIMIIMIIIILSFDIAPSPYKHVQRRIAFRCQWIDVGIHIII